MTPTTSTTASEPASAPTLKHPFSSPLATTTPTLEISTNKHKHADQTALPTSTSFVDQATNLSQPATVTTNSSALSTTTATTMPPPVVYGELSILGYNGYIPNGEKSGRRNRSKFLLCQRSIPNGIKKSRHYFVKHPQATKAIQDKELHSISFTFSRSQTIIVEYRQDETTDMFQIGRSSEDPIDFIVLDTLLAGCNPSDPVQENSNNNGRHASKHSSSNSHHHQHNENSSSSHHQLQQQQIIAGDIAGLSRLQRHLAKVGEEMLQYGFPPGFYDQRARLHMQAAAAAVAANGGAPHNQAMPLNFPQPTISNFPPIIAEQLRNHNLALAQQQAHHLHQNIAHVPSSSSHQQFLSSARSNHLTNNNNNVYTEHNSSGGSGRHNNTTNDTNNNTNNDLICKRSRTTQSTISRFACRILVDRKPPCTARIYAAGFDSSKNIFLGEKATKWEQNNSIDGLTTNGVLLMHPKRSNESILECDGGGSGGGVWREVSVDGGIYAIRESRSAIQKGRRIEEETNILQDGTLIDLCGATLLWRSVDGFKSSPTKKTLEEKIDQLNASRPQCPVNLNTLVIPRKPILPSHLHHSHHQQQSYQQASHSHNHHRSGASEHHSGQNNRHHNSDRHQRHNHNHSNGSNNSNCDNGNNSSPRKDGQQPYVYLKCGHVQGYHDWGTTGKTNHRTCPICFSVGAVAKLSMGLEPSFYVDSGPLTHVFNPCGHMASEKTVKYWCSIKIPHGTHFFHSICPFCATQLATDEKEPWTKLIFQDDLD